MKSSFEVWIILPLLVMLVAFSFLFQSEAGHFFSYVDWRAVISLTGLLLVSKGISESGYLSYLAHLIARTSNTERDLIFKLCLLSAALGAVVTNDAAVMVIVSLTMSLKGSIDIRKATTLEVISANAGSTLTPIGNPQNLLIWHLWGVSFLQFSIVMVKVVLIQLAVISILLLTVGKKPVVVTDREPEVNKILRTVSIVLLIILVVALDLGLRWVVLPILIFYAVSYRDVVTKTNWMLILIFVLMFIDFRILASVFGRLLNMSGKDVFLGSVLASQLFNNVPAAVLMTEVSNNYPAIVAGVNVGGSGLITASFANLIAYGMVREKGFVWRYHSLSLIFLVMCVAIIYWFVF